MRRKKATLILFSLVFFCNEIHGKTLEDEMSFLEWAKVGEGTSQDLLSSKTPQNFVGKRELMNSPPQQTIPTAEIPKANPKENELIPQESKIDFIEAQNGPTLDPNPEPDFESSSNPESGSVKPERTVPEDVVFLALGKDQSDQENAPETHEVDSTTKTSAVDAEKSDDSKKEEEEKTEPESVTIIDAIDTEITSTTTVAPVAPPKAQSDESGEALLTWRTNPETSGSARRKSHRHPEHAHSSAVNRARIRNRMRDIYHAYFVKKQREERSHNSKNEDRCAHIQCKPPPEDANCEMEKTNIQIPLHSKFHTLQNCCPLWFCTSKVDGTFYTHYGMYSTKKVAHLSRRHRLNSRNHIHVPRLQQNMGSTDEAVVDSSSSPVADPVSVVPVSVSVPAPEQGEKAVKEPEVESDKHFEAQESTYYKYTENTDRDGKKDAKLAGASSRSLSGSGQNPIPIQTPIQSVAAISMQTPNFHPQIPVPAPAEVETVNPIQGQFAFSLNTPQIQPQNSHHKHHSHPQPANPTPFVAAFTPITFPQLPQFSFSDFTGSFTHDETPDQNHHENHEENNNSKSGGNENPFAIFDDPNFPFVNPFRSSETTKPSASSKDAHQIQMSNSNGHGNFGFQVQN